MESYILIQNKRGPVSRRGGNNVATAALCALAAVAATATLTLALLPPADVVIVRQLLAAASPAGVPAAAVAHV